ncbi:MAG: HEAT repeat domain-containing protein, partial [Fuerstia sp.]|nr:HEAT repeat domain-containing protein [Fuerstiella sp.]
MNSNRTLVVLLAVTVFVPCITGSCVVAQQSDASQDAQPQEEVHQVSWQHSLDDALKIAGNRRAPVLLVFGAEWCGPCRLLDEEIQLAGVQAELERWVPVHIDIDDDQTTAGRFAITSIPALRILSPDGRQLAGQEGLMPADELVAWLQKHHTLATGATAAAGSTEKLNSATVHRVLRDFSSREATVRETAISRVLTVPQYAAANVVSEFADASLAERLAYLEVLTAWQAPVEGLDPWIPDTVTSERISALEEWVTKKEFPDRDLESALTAAEIIEARRLLRLLVSADPAAATALREQLARMGPKVLPLIRELMARELDDDIRAQLAAARYRVAASDQIVNDWPGGIERLASTDHQQRIAAMQELSKRASRSDEHLLGELVADPVPLIREIALHMLAKIDGGRADGPLLKMLDDPDPNVRAAVLKTLSETDPDTGATIATASIV